MSEMISWCSNSTEVNDIWGWVDPENGDEYAVVCTYGGTSFVRITDPSNPVVVGYLPTRYVYYIFQWRILDFPVGKGSNFMGRRQLTTRLRFVKFVCQNGRIGTLVGVLAAPRGSANIFMYFTLNIINIYELRLGGSRALHGV